MFYILYSFRTMRFMVVLRIVSFLFEREYWQRCFETFRNMTDATHSPSILLGNPKQPLDTPCINVSFIRAPRNTKTGGMGFPLPHIIAHLVTRLPDSPGTTQNNLAYLFDFSASVYTGGCTTIIIPVSFTLDNLSSDNMYFSITLLQFSWNRMTFVESKLVAHVF